MNKTVLAPLIASTMFWLSACAPVQAPSATQAEAAPQVTPMVIESPSQVPRITLEEAKEHFDNGTAIFVDTRSQEQYDQTHIAGAVLKPATPEAFGDVLPKDQLIIAYCT